MSEICDEIIGVVGGTVHELRAGREKIEEATFDAGRLPAQSCGLCGYPMVLDEIEMGDGNGRSGAPFTGYAEWWRCTDCGTHEVVQVPQ